MLKVLIRGHSLCLIFLFPIAWGVISRKNKQFFFSESNLASLEAYISADGSMKQSQELTTNTKTFQLKKTSEVFQVWDSFIECEALFLSTLSLCILHISSDPVHTTLYLGSLPVWIIKKESPALWFLFGLLMESLKELSKKEEWDGGYPFPWPLPAGSTCLITFLTMTLYNRSSSRLW